MDHRSYRRGGKSAILQALAAASALGVGVPMGLPKPRPPREKTPEDIAKLEAAEAKRKRKALKRQVRKP